MTAYERLTRSGQNKGTRFDFAEPLVAPRQPPFAGRPCRVTKTALLEQLRSYAAAETHAQFILVMREAAMAQAAPCSISGTVLTSLPSISVGGLTVTARQVADGDVEPQGAQLVTAMTKESGTYTIHLPEPGRYMVRMESPCGVALDPASPIVEVGRAEDAGGVDFTIVLEWHS